MFDDTGGGQAAVSHRDFPLNALRVGLGRRTAEGWLVVSGLDDTGPTITTVGEHEGGPLLSIPEDAARALYDALAAHFDGTSGARQLRRDYDAERKRVDRFIDHLTGKA